MEIDNALFRIRQIAYSKAVQYKLVRKRPLIAPSGSVQKSFYRENIMAGQEGNDFCRKALQNNKPCMLGRIGTVEMGVINAYLSKKAGIINKICGERTQLLCNNAGFFPDNEESVTAFAELYLDAASRLDALGVFNRHEEDYFQYHYAKNARMMQFTTYEAFYFSNPWTKALMNKRVLVVHPFEKSIRTQYKKRKILFDDPDFLPDFDLLTIKAVQTIGGKGTLEFQDWFAALNYMKSQIADVEFDIALIGCGAYAFPLAAYVKDLGKKAVITAGATQLLFGIKGSRWDHAETPVPYKDSWIRPDKSERPAGAETVEDGCYW